MRGNKTLQRLEEFCLEDMSLAQGSPRHQRSVLGLLLPSAGCSCRLLIGHREKDVLHCTTELVCVRPFLLDDSKTDSRMSHQILNS